MNYYELYVKNEFKSLKIYAKLLPVSKLKAYLVERGWCEISKSEYIVNYEKNVLFGELEGSKILCSLPISDDYHGAVVLKLETIFNEALIQGKSMLSIIADINDTL